MSRNNTDDFKQLKSGLVVSCQALSDEPLHSSFIMGKMALAAYQGGAVGIRANGVTDIQAIKQSVNLPIIGIIKQDYPNSSVRITPTMQEINLLIEEKVDIIALDATLRERPDNITTEDFIAQIKTRYPNQLLMADIATIEEAIMAEKIGVDIIGTTLYGYTENTIGCDISHDDFSYLKALLDQIHLPVIAEGKINTPEKARRVLDLGVFSVVVGGAITRPQEITARFVQCMQSVSTSSITK